MNGKQLDYVRGTVRDEGFDYTFRDYSDFREITDSEFHKLREDYVKAAEALVEYLGIED